MMDERKNVAEVETRSSRVIKVTQPLDMVRFKKYLNLEDDVEVVLVDSGKSAIFILMEFFRSTGQLNDRDSQVLFPQWIGSWVYNIAFKTCFPSNVPSQTTKGIFVYHQYGYPQLMKEIMHEAQKNHWFVIEDCAHGIESYVEGRRVGLIGDAGFFSFSKFFPTMMGGAIITRRKDIADFARAMGTSYLPWASGWSYWSKWFALSESLPKSFRRNSNLLVEMSYNAYDRGTKINPRALNILKAELEAGSLIQRRANADILFKELKNYGLLDQGENISVLPYVMPLFGSSDRLNVIKQKMQEIKVSTGIYQFDRNFNLLNPNFTPCLWVPVHPGLSRSRLERIIQIIKSS